MFAVVSYTASRSQSRLCAEKQLNVMSLRSTALLLIKMKFNAIAVLAAISGVSAAELAERATTNTALQTSLPKSSGTSALSAAKTIAAGVSFDCGMKKFDRSPSTCEDQSEGGDADAVFILKAGATLSNCIIGPNNGEGVHCKGTCTLNNVWWSNVCEDALTLKQTSGTSYVNGGGAFSADDKVLQHNGGGTLAVKNFYAEDVGKVYRSCGNCDTQYKRKSTFTNIRVNGASVVAGINENYGDTTVIKNSCILDSSICWLYDGNDDGDEPTKVASKPDGTYCVTSSVSTKSC
ncbi:MAG: hypothetical protein M1834_003863 [Cirrosporium novae-zelandiae]|nr:MAG: hypothetical protein M1834_003863 [Cirrosporium novae-zelandiae]